MGKKRRLNSPTEQNSSMDADVNNHEKNLTVDPSQDGKKSRTPLQVLMIPTIVADLTPTPTRFLRSCEEAGLFNEISKNAYTEDFKQDCSYEPPVPSEESMSVLPSQQQAPIPSVILESIADEAEDDISVNTQQINTGFVPSNVEETGSPLMYETTQEADVPTDMAVNLQSAERPLVQVLLQLPSGGFIPLNLPADVLAHATVPAIAATTSPAAAAAPIPQVVTSAVTSAPASGITFSTKQKLKTTLHQNVQNCRQSQSVPLKRPLPQQPVQLQKHQPRHQQSPILAPAAMSRLSDVSLTKSSKLSVVTTEISDSINTHQNEDAGLSVMSTSSRSTDDDDSDEKRKKFLESNRAAANRCRQKKKQWINSLEEKTKRLLEDNKTLTTETAQLRREIDQLKEELVQHKDCSPITILTSNF